MKFTIIGNGAVSSALLPLLVSHFENYLTSLRIISPCLTGATNRIDTAGISLIPQAITKDNHTTILSDLDKQTILINLSVDVASIDLVLLCQKKGAIYLDTCIEPWAGHYFNNAIPLEARTNFTLRANMLALKQQCLGGPTALIAHGANPGLVSPEGWIDQQMLLRKPAFEHLTSYLRDEFTILLSIAFDEITSTRAYKQDFELFDSLGPHCLSTWIRNAARDEATHYANAMTLLKRGHSERFAEAADFLGDIVNLETSETFGYHNTFIFEHDTDDFSKALLSHSRITILDALGRHP